MRILPFLLIPSSLSINKMVRNNIISYQHNKCGHCRSSFTKLVPYEIHRMNGKKNDTRRNNLIALCSNCHNGHHRYNITIYPYFDQ